MNETLHQLLHESLPQISSRLRTMGYVLTGDGIVVADAIDELLRTKQWTAYKPGDVVPAGMSYWVVVRDDGGFNYSRRNPFIVERNEDGKGGALFYDWQWGGIDNLVTHYIPIATPEPPK